MKKWVYLYRIFLLPIMSFLYEGILVIKHARSLVCIMDKADSDRKKLRKLDDILYLMGTNYDEKYKPDPSLFGKLTWNWKPSMPYVFFLLRDGGDCSIHARVYKELLDQICIKSSLWMITNNDKVSTAHVVCIFKHPAGGWAMFNVNHYIHLPNATGPYEMLGTLTWWYNKMRIYTWW